MIDKISVIIPVYKVEKYLKKCVESVINQTYTNLEIILVDDGSPDKCPSICDYFEEKDKRIKVIHKVNGGLSDARNYGIKEATGHWITFIDSDDYVAADYIEYLYELVMTNNADISIVLPQIFYEGKDVSYAKKNKEKILQFDKNSALKIMLYQKEFDTSAWGKLYKRSLFKNIEFPKGKIYEDISTVYKAILKSNKITFSNQKKYFYLKRKDSIMGQKFKSADMDYVYQAREMYNGIKKLNNNTLEQAARCRYLNANFSILKKIKFSKNNKKYIYEIGNNIKKLRKNIIIDKNVRFKTKLAVIMSYLIFF